jgi:hypothetical protein
MRHRLVLLGLGTILVAAGCGGSHGSAAAQVNSASCAVSSGLGKPAAQSCTFGLNDGRRLGCKRSFTGPTPSVPQLVRAGCHWLAPLRLSRPMRAVIARIVSDRRCLASRGLRVLGGPAFPSRPPDPVQPDGELVISSATDPTFIALYTDAAKANRIEPALRREDSGKHVFLERRGAVTIAYSQAPTGELRHAVRGCVYTQ